MSLSFHLAERDEYNHPRLADQPIITHFRDSLSNPNLATLSPLGQLLRHLCQPIRVEHIRLF